MIDREKPRWCPLKNDKCVRDDITSYGHLECKNCPLDSLRAIADEFEKHNRSSSDNIDEARSVIGNLFGQIIPPTPAAYPQPTILPGVSAKFDVGMKAKWWPDTIICKKCGADIVISEEPEELEIDCPTCGEENIITAVRKV